MSTTTTRTQTTATMTVGEACTVLGEERDDALAVLTMSAIAYWPDVRPDDYRLMGLMGSAGAIGLGLALGLPERPVWVLDGDGSLLMQLGVLCAVSDAGPANLVHLVFDNGIYAISGAQPTPGAVDWRAMFRAAGYADGVACSTPAALREAIRRPHAGPLGIAVRCVNERPEYPAGAFGVSPAAEAKRVRGVLAGG
jgi:thiamine pyrophosphate-dependent acetolactate synthase large subunit-like protein